MQILKIDTENDNSLSVENKTKYFCFVVLSTCSEKDLDYLDEFFKDLNLDYSEESKDFAFEEARYLQVHSTEDSHECDFVNLLPYIFESQQEADEFYLKIKNESGFGKTNIFKEYLVLDAGKVQNYLQKTPYSFGMGSDLNYKK